MPQRAWILTTVLPAVVLSVVQACAAFAGAGDEATKYVEVPLIGEFGKDIYPKGVDRALEKAVKDKVQYVVFHVRSGGGQVWAGKEISSTIQKYDGKLRMVALIEDALSATLLPMMACDQLFMLPGARIGAAVAYTKERSTGAVQVDEKFNSAFAAELAALAQSKGRNTLVVRAMVLPEVEVFKVRHADGKLTLESVRPPAQSGQQVEVLNERNHILTLTGTEAAAIGFTSVIPAANLEAVRAALGVTEWKSDGGYGAEYMKEAARRGQTIRDRATAIKKDCKDAIVAFERDRPEKFKYFYDAATGLLDAESRQRWASNTDKAVDDLTTYRTKLREYLDLKRQSQAQGLELLFAEFDKQDLLKQETEINKALEELRANRDRSTANPR